MRDIELYRHLLGIASPWTVTQVEVIWKTLLIAEKTFRRLDAPEPLADVARGEVYVNGVRAVNRSEKKAAA